MSDRFRDALKRAWRKIEEEEWVYGTVGRKNSDGSFTFVVPGRPTFIFVTIRNATGAQTVVPARNDATVPHTPRLPVRMKLEHGNYVIYAKSGRQDLSNLPPSPPYGLVQHATSHKHGGSDEVATATPGANAIPKAEGDGKLAGGWLDSADISKAFTDLTDVPAVYTGEAGNVVQVNATEDGLEFGVPSSVDDFTDLSDVPSSYVGHAGKLVRVNAVPDALEFVAPYAHPNHTGEVTSVGDGATTIANDVVTNAKAADMAADTIKGRANGAGTGDPTDLTAAQVRTIINVENGADVTDAGNVGAAIDGSPEQTVLASGNKIAMTEAGVLEWVDWDTILATIGSGFVDLTTNQSVAGEKTWEDDAVFESDFTVSGSSGSFTILPNAAFGIYTTLAAISSQEAALVLGNPTATWQIWRKPSPDANLYFYNGAERVTFLSDGKVGIGKTPTSFLDVAGYIRSSGLVTGAPSSGNGIEMIHAGTGG